MEPLEPPVPIRRNIPILAVVVLVVLVALGVAFIWPVTGPRLDQQRGPPGKRDASLPSRRPLRFHSTGPTHTPLLARKACRGSHKPDA